ncbi:hypothetical protein OKA04_19760 [Luteolibacter flavescens]|uniref:Uncharacterized protein n=1 Tax=Luteolibacter flavescens TaxID=1859460 RepID=A0ABT3FTS7_9BACT|nr:hypothetical protein [Luteolibacter flavescens]MCW1886985.1 hypothetical protein [Luteolibacter flavescens]
MILEQLMLQHRDPKSALAVAYLAAPDAFPGLPRRIGNIRVKLLKIPSFEPCTAWTLFEDQGTFCVRRIEWNQREDPETSPGAQGSDAAINSSIATTLLDGLTALTIPVAPKTREAGIDGVSYSVIIGDYWCNSEFAWWVEPPEEWKKLAIWYDRAIAAFEAVLPVRTPENPEA